ncbi:Lipid phosphate phosphatase 2 [Platanthera guangdongensis]|uniref:Lipid phosphate phosphatase 2 n=1 Tax=Platanthera guangdongensis TaxID=2320717 RepID=A0ABR2LDD4_9ASPA
MKRSTITGGSTKSSRIERLTDNSPLHATSDRQYSHDWKTDSSTLHPRSTAARARSFVRSLTQQDCEPSNKDQTKESETVISLHLDRRLKNKNPHTHAESVVEHVSVQDGADLVPANPTNPEHDIDIEPFHRFVGMDMMADLRYPLKSNTVPVWAVSLIAILLPAFIIIGLYIKKPYVYDLHNALLGLLFSMLIVGLLTVAIKDAVGRPRSDFFWRCFPDGKEMDAADFNDMASRSGQFSVISSYQLTEEMNQLYCSDENKLAEI